MEEMTKTYLVTGAGCRRREETLVVPEGVQIIFYQARPRPRGLSVVRTPNDELMIATKLLTARAAGPGETIPSAFCWERDGKFPPSGVHRRSTGLRVMDLSDTSARQPVSLEHIVRQLALHRDGRPTIVHWLVESAEPHPVRKLWQLQHPRRLFKGDGDESGHAPLDDLSGLEVSELPSWGELDEEVPAGWVTVSARR